VVPAVNPATAFVSEVEVVLLTVGVPAAIVVHVANAPVPAVVVAEVP
jgi:hypothetical protein